MQQLEKIFATEESSLREAMGIARVVNETRGRTATLTAGDLRRAVLAGLNLDLTIATLLKKIRSQGKPGPITLPINSAKEAIIREMKARAIRQIPLVDEQGRVIELAELDEVVEDPTAQVQAVRKA